MLMHPSAKKPLTNEQKTEYISSYIKSLDKQKDNKNGTSLYLQRAFSLISQMKTPELIEFNDIYIRKNGISIPSSLSMINQNENDSKLFSLLTDLFSSYSDYDCNQIFKAIEGLGTDEDTLIEIFSSRSQRTILKLKQRFEELYKQELVQYVKDDTSGDFQKLLVALLQCVRNENEHPLENECSQWAEEIYQAGEGRLGTDEEFFIKTFTIRSRAELRMINKIYENKYKSNLENAIEKEFSGDIKKLLKSILRANLDKVFFFSRNLYKAFNMKLIGIDENMINRIIISRRDFDLERIKDRYFGDYGISLYEMVNKKYKDNNCKKLILALLKK